MSSYFAVQNKDCDQENGWREFIELYKNCFVINFVCPFDI